MPCGGVEALDDGVHLAGEVDRPQGVVDPRQDQPAAGEVAAAQRAHLLDADALGGLVELAHDVVELGQRRRRVELAA